MTAASRQICPCCHGTGYSQSVPEAEIEAIGAGLRAACKAAGRKVTGDGQVSEATAAMLVGRAPGTMRNWRALHRPIPFCRRGGRISYAIIDIARWMANDADAQLEEGFSNRKRANA